MDLLNDLNDAPRAAVYRKEVNLEAFYLSDDEGAATQALNPTPPPPRPVSSILPTFDLSILARVKRRLNGEAEPPVEEITEVAQTEPVAQTAPFPPLALTQATQRVSTMTQRLDQGTQELAVGTPVVATPTTSDLPPLPQIHTDATLLASVSPSPSTREERVRELMEQKRAARVLAAELYSQTLTDEENEMDEANASVVSSASHRVTRKEREALELATLNLTREFAFKRRPKPAAVSKSAFLNAFNRSSPVTSPVTSPISSPVKAPREADTITATEREAVAEGILNHPPNVMSNPLGAYKIKLQEELADHSTVALDSDEDLAELTELTSKANRLEVKHRFQKRNMAKKGISVAVLRNTPTRASTKLAGRKQMFDDLHARHRAQLINERLEVLDMDGAQIVELEKEHQEMENLLEREIERNRRIRMREKKEARETGVSDDDASDGSVADSAEDSGDNQSEDDEDEDESEDEKNTDGDSDPEMKILPHRRKRAAILSDDEDSPQYPAVAEPNLTSVTNLDAADESLPIGLVEGDDSFHIGSYGEADFDHVALATQTQAAQPVGPGVLDELRHHGRVRVPLGESERDDTLDVSFTKAFEPTMDRGAIEEDLQETQISEVPQFSQRGGYTQTQRDNGPTQADATQMDDTRTQCDVNLEGNPNQLEADTQLVQTLPGDPHQDEPRGAKVSRRRRVIEDSDAELSEDEVTKTLRVEKERQAERKQRLLEKKQRLLMERSGMRQMVDQEAEESEDEWAGVGGADGEVSDQENSDDERMIDRSLIDVKEGTLRAKAMDDDKQEEDKLVNKMLDDLKNHRWAKRGAKRSGAGLLDDDDASVLYQYYKTKTNFQKEHLLKNQQMLEMSRDAKSKAFFDSIADENVQLKLDISDNDDEFALSDDVDDPEVQEPLELLAHAEAAREVPEVKRRRVTVTSAFVQKSLSFLTEEVAVPEVDEDPWGEGGEDLHSLKQRSLVLGIQRLEPAPVAVDVGDDEFSIPRLRSFRAAEKTQRSTEDLVTVSSGYKAKSNSKAAVTAIRTVVPKRELKVKKIEKSVRGGRKDLRKVFAGGRFS